MKTRILAVLFGLTLLLDSRQCSAEPVMQLEGGMTMLRGPAASIGATVAWPGAGPRHGDFQCGLFLISQYEADGKTQPNQGIAHCQVIMRVRRFAFGLGPAFLQNMDAINGSHFNFSLMAGYQVTPQLSIAWRHFSNAGTKSPNKGRDAVMAAWAF